MAAAGSIELGVDIGGGNMDVAGGGVDVGVAQQGLHHRQIHTGLGQSGGEVWRKAWGCAAVMPVISR